jgi:glutathione synthase/RimK-type ligase-like ATP-grasp enzyme
MIKQLLLRPNPAKFDRFARDKYASYLVFSDMQPYTAIYSQKELKNTMECYGQAILKPRFSSKGEGIYLVKDITNLPEFEDEYLVQQRILTPDFFSRVFDIRVLVQKDKHYVYSRVSPKYSIITNLAKGGRAESTEEILNFVFPHKKARILRQLDLMVKRIEQRLNRDYQYSKIGVDFLLDVSGRLWLLELNSQPGIMGFFNLANASNSVYENYSINYDEDFRNKQKGILAKILENGWK